MARRGDGLLSHDLDPGEKGPQDACGVFGVWAPGEEAATLCFYGLYALQHRGQESAGIASSDGDGIRVFKEMGLVSQVFNEQALSSLKGYLAIGHTRYSTTGSSTWSNAQPILKGTSNYSIALAHNGNLTNIGELAKELSKTVTTQKNPEPANSDSELIAALLTRDGNVSVEQSIIQVLPLLEGAFSLALMDEETLYAARDRNGIRPLVIGKLKSGWVVASETAALDIVGASFVREVEPGEFISINQEGFKTQKWAPAEPKGCIFEYVYLARPDTAIAGVGVHKTRVEIGRQLARECPADADLVIPVPESGTPAAIGYSRESKIPYALGFVKNSYVGRTFIQPSQTIRQLGLRLKLNPLVDVVAGKKIVVVDDSIVRGNTQRAIVKMLREAGAREIHVRISSPPVKWPCFYGIDFATKAELIGAGLDLNEIRRSIGADSLGYLSIEGLITATTIEESALCTACFTGKYPVRIPISLNHDQQLLPFLEN